ncbi:MAG: hypothetical protein ABI114_16280 [Rhodanobacter sp.]
MNEAHLLFTNLQPPRGGLQRLRSALEGQPQHARRPLAYATAGAFALTVLGAAWLLPSMIAQHQQTAELTSALRATITPLDNGIRMTTGAAIKLPSGQPNVQLYLLGSLPNSR